MLFDCLSTVRTPKDILFRETRFDDERRIMLSYPRPPASLVAGVNTESLAQLFFNCWLWIACLGRQSKLRGAEAAS